MPTDTKTLRERVEALQRYAKHFVKHVWHSYAGDSHIVLDPNGEWLRRADVLAMVAEVERENRQRNDELAATAQSSVLVVVDRALALRNLAHVSHDDEASEHLRVIRAQVEALTLDYLQAIRDRQDEIARLRAEAARVKG